MKVVQVRFQTSLGIQVRYLATILTNGIIVSVVGISHIDAIARCLKEFNELAHHEPA